MGILDGICTWFIASHIHHELSKTSDWTQASDPTEKPAHIVVYPIISPTSRCFLGEPSLTTPSTVACLRELVNWSLCVATEKSAPSDLECQYSSLLLARRHLLRLPSMHHWQGNVDLAVLFRCHSCVVSDRPGCREAVRVDRGSH